MVINTYQINYFHMKFPTFCMNFSYMSIQIQEMKLLTTDGAITFRNTRQAHPNYMYKE